jgi:hypothetical protein
MLRRLACHRCKDQCACVVLYDVPEEAVACLDDGVEEALLDAFVQSIRGWMRLVYDGSEEAVACLRLTTASRRSRCRGKAVEALVGGC